MTKSFSSMEKKAAYDALLENGYTFDSATEAIEKEAGLGASLLGKVKGFASAAAADAGKVGAQAKSLRTGQTILKGDRFTTNASITRGAAAKELAGNKAVQGATGAMATAAAGGAALGSTMSNRNRNQEKQACLNMLLDQGVDFSTAIELVKQAEQEVYKK